MSDNPEVADFMRRLLEDADERTAAAEGFYAMLKARRQLGSHRVLTYRCKRRCLLVDVLSTKRGVLVHQGRYKLSRGLNEASSTAAGRESNTEDGARRWKARTYFLDQAANLTLACDHIAHRVIELDEVRAALDSDTREVVVG